MINEVVYLRLMNSEQVVARLVEDNGEFITVIYPMLVDDKVLDGASAINLIKYLPFSTDQRLILKKDHVISATVVNLAFAQYYYNSVHYHAVHVQPETEANLTQINRSLENVLSDDSKNFVASVKKHSKRIPEQLSTKVH